MAKQIFDVSEYQFNGGVEFRARGISSKLVHCLLPYDIGGAKETDVARYNICSEPKKTRILKIPG